MSKTNTSKGKKISNYCRGCGREFLNIPNTEWIQCTCGWKKVGKVWLSPIKQLKELSPSPKPDKKCKNCEGTGRIKENGYELCYLCNGAGITPKADKEKHEWCDHNQDPKGGRFCLTHGSFLCKEKMVGPHKFTGDITYGCDVCSKDPDDIIHTPKPDTRSWEDRFDKEIIKLNLDLIDGDGTGNYTEMLKSFIRQLLSDQAKAFEEMIFLAGDGVHTYGPQVWQIDKEGFDKLVKKLK